MARMLGMEGFPAMDPQGLSPEAAALFAQMRRHIEQQEQRIADDQALLRRMDREIALKEAKLEKVAFELARFEHWKFGARTEAMSAPQRRLFDETLAEDEAALQVGHFSVGANSSRLRHHRLLLQWGVGRSARAGQATHRAAKEVSA